MRRVGRGGDSRLWGEPLWIGTYTIVATILLLVPWLVGRPVFGPWGLATLSGLLAGLYGIWRVSLKSTAQTVESETSPFAQADWITLAAAAEKKPLFLLLGMPPCDADEFLHRAKVARDGGANLPNSSPLYLYSGSFLNRANRSQPCSFLACREESAESESADGEDDRWKSFCKGIAAARRPKVPLNGIVVFVGNSSDGRPDELRTRLKQMDDLRRVGGVQCPCFLVLEDKPVLGQLEGWPGLELEIAPIPWGIPTDAAQEALAGPLDRFFNEVVPTRAVRLLEPEKSIAGEWGGPRTIPSRNSQLIRWAEGWRRLWSDHRTSLVSTLLAMREATRKRKGRLSPGYARDYRSGLFLMAPDADPRELIERMIEAQAWAMWTVAARRKVRDQIRDVGRARNRTIGVLVLLTAVQVGLVAWAWKAIRNDQPQVQGGRP